MTRQTKHFIEVSDIVGIRLECKNCGSSLLISLGKTGRLLLTCANCNHELWEDIEGLAQKGIQQLIAAIKTIERVIENQRVKFSLEINPETMRSASQMSAPEQ